MNAVHPAGDVQVVLMCVDSPPAGLNTLHCGHVKHRNKHTGVSVPAIYLFTPSSPNLKVVVFSDELQGNENAAGYMQASLGTLHKIYLTRKQSHINIDILILLVAAYHNWYEMIVAMKCVDCKKLNKKILYMLLM